MTDAHSIPGLVRVLPWDSEYFGFQVAFVEKRTITPAEQEEVEAFAKREKVVLLQYLCDCQDQQSVRTAEAAGYSFVDIRYTLKRSLIADIPPAELGAYAAGRATEADIPVLRAIAHDAYRDSRYYYDGNFDREKIISFYQEWVEKGVRGMLEDYAEVLYDNGTPVAFCTVKRITDKEAKIGLFGVDGAKRGKGLGTKLLRHALQQLRNDGAETVSVVTQGRNYAGQRLYQTCGFTTELLELWYHKWYKTPRS